MYKKTQQNNKKHPPPTLNKKKQTHKTRNYDMIRAPDLKGRNLLFLF